MFTLLLIVDFFSCCINLGNCDFFCKHPELDVSVTFHKCANPANPYCRKQFHAICAPEVYHSRAEELNHTTYKINSAYHTRCSIKGK